jgi:hypothetical protein
MASQLKVPGQGLVQRTNFFREPPEYGETLIFDYYCSGQATSTVRVQKVKRKSFIVDGNRKVMKRDGKVVGFDTAIVRRDAETAKKMLRQAQEKRLEYFEFNSLPSKILRSLNEILDTYEVEKEVLRKRYALSKEVAKENPNRFKGGGKSGSREHGKPKAPSTRSTRSALDDETPKKVVKSTWGRKGFAHREFDPEPDTEDD